MSFVTKEMKEEAVAQEESQAQDTYSQAFDANGESFAGVRWASREGQELRFAVLSEVADLNGASILDVGCGFGHFGQWLAQQRINVDYTGLDIAGRLVDQARLRMPESAFIADSILSYDFGSTKYDYVFACGLFADYPKGGTAWMIDVIEKMWSLSTKAVAFNSLSLWTPNREAGEYHANPAEIVDQCRHMTHWVSMRHDYHPRDFTVFMRHEKAG